MVNVMDQTLYSENFSSKFTYISEHNIIKNRVDLARSLTFGMTSSVNMVLVANDNGHFFTAWQITQLCEC